MYFRDVIVCIFLRCVFVFLGNVCVRVCVPEICVFLRCVCVPF